MYGISNWRVIGSVVKSKSQEECRIIKLHSLEDEYWNLKTHGKLDLGVSFEDHETCTIEWIRRNVSVIMDNTSRLDDTEPTFTERSVYTQENGVDQTFEKSDSVDIPNENYNLDEYFPTY